MSRKTILHIAPFIWTMGFQKGIFGVQSYTLFEKYGYNTFFMVPDINLFHPLVKISNEMIKKAKLNGLVFKFSKLVGALNLTDNVGSSSFLNQIVFFFLYMLNCFFTSLKVICKLRNVVCIYAHAWACVPPAFLLSKLFGIPCVSRVYGVHNYQMGLFGNAMDYMSKPDLFIFKIPCNAYVITNDGTMGKQVAMRMGVPENKILFALDGVPEHSSDRIQKMNIDSPNPSLAFLSQKKVILYIGRLIEWKRIDRLITVLSLVCQKIPGIDICLVIAGDGPLLDYLKKLVSSLNLEEHVVFLGSVERDQLSDLFDICDIYLTLQDLTNLSNSVLEAMSQGRCVVAGDVGSTRDVIENMITGFLVPIHDIEKISSIIVELISNDHLLFSVGKKAKLYASKHFLDWNIRIRYEFNWISEKFFFDSAS